MLKLLALEYKKFKNHTTIKLFGAMFLVCMVLPVFVGEETTVNSTINNQNSLFSMSDFLKFPEIWTWYGYYASWAIFFFLGFMVLTSVTAEFGYKTLRQNIITGLNRNQYFISKIQTIVILSLITTLFFAIIGFYLGTKNSLSWDFYTDLPNLKILYKVFLVSMAYSSFALLLSFIFKNNGLTIFFYVSSILFLEKIAGSIANRYSNTEIGEYFPISMISSIFPFPVFNAIEQMTTVQMPGSNLAENSILLFSSIYTILFLIAAYIIFIKRDI